MLNRCRYFLGNFWRKLGYFYANIWSHSSNFLIELGREKMSHEAGAASKDLDPVVAEIDDENEAVWCDGDAARTIELAEIFSGQSELLQEDAGAGKHLKKSARLQKLIPKCQSPIQ